MKPHQFSYNGMTYDFCVKCGVRWYARDSKGCVTSLRYGEFDEKHDLAQIIVKGRSVSATTIWNFGEYSCICKKCRILASTNPGKHLHASAIQGEQIVVPYLKSIAGGSCYHPSGNAVLNEALEWWTIPCSYTDDDVVIEDIIV